MTLAVILSLPFLYVIARRPLLRRLAFRNVARRPREAALVVLGSLLGTAIITGAFVVGDTLHHSLDAQALEHLGPIDEVIALPDRERWSEASERLAAFRHDDIDGIAPLAVTAAPVATTGPNRRAAPSAQLIETDFARAASLGPFAESGVRGPAPKPGTAVMSAQLARRIGAKPGDKIEVFAYGKTLPFTVDRVLPQRGVAGFVLAFGAVADNLFVPAGTLADLDAVAASSDRAPTPPAWLVAVSNRGTATSGVVHTESAVTALLGAMRGLRADVVPAKQIAFDAAAANGEATSRFFNAMGAFGVLAGVLLLINVVAMLAEERTVELGMMRAVGLRRASFIGAFCIEGWIYSLLAGVLGTAAGIGLGRFMVGLTQDLYAAGDSAFGLDLAFTATWSSIQRGFASGLVVSLATVVVTSWRISRFDVIRAIRDLPDQPAQKPAIWPVLAGMGAATLGIAWGAAAATAGDAIGIVAGPTLAFVGLIPVLARSLSRRTAITACGLGVVAWLSIGIFFVGRGPTNDSLVPVALQGVCLVGAGVLVVAQQQDRIGGLLRRVTRGVNGLAARLGLAYPLARQFRTTLTLAPFTLVVFTLTFITSVAALITSGIDVLTKGTAGGYEAVVHSSSTNPIDIGALERRDGVRHAAAVAHTLARMTTTTGVTKSRPLSAIDESVLETAPPELLHAGRYRSAKEAFEAVARANDLVMVTDAFMTADEGGSENDDRVPRWEVGATLTISDPVTDTGREYTVAAVLVGDFSFNGAIIGRRGAEQIFPTGLPVNRAWVDLEGSPSAWAQEIETRFVPNGTEVIVFAEVGDDVFRFILQLVNIYRSYLGLGLIVGVAGIGVVMVRAVRERRHQIGLLRSLGFDSKLVGRSFMFEAAFVAVEGIVLGVGLALLTAYTTSKSDTIRDLIGTNPPFVVPVWSLALLVVGVLASALLSALGPARSAARIPPSVALRLVD